MSQRRPDYDAYRAREATVTVPDEYGNYINHELAAECEREIAATAAALERKP